MKTADAVVIGGGVIGTSIAYRLAEGNRKVILIEKEEIGSQTSASCDKAIFLQSKKPGLPSELAKASRAVYENLEDELNFSFEFKRGGGMIVVQSEKYLPFMKDFVEKQREAGIDIQFLDRKEARDRQPCLSEDIVGSTYSSEDAEVNPMLLSQGFAYASKRKGVDIRTHTEVVNIVVENGKVVGVQTTNEYFSTDIVVNAAGPFAPQIGNMADVTIPVQPRRGVILISEKISPIVQGNILCSQYIAAKHFTQETPAFGIGLSLGQTDAGNLLIGASREFKGFNKSVEAEVLPNIAKHAATIVPGLGNVRIIRSMVGFRPYTGDGMPIIDEAREAKGFIIATGHEGDGIALAPITGLLVRDLIDRKRDDESMLDQLKLDRFKS